MGPLDSASPGGSLAQTPEIRIFVSCHQPYPVPAHPMLVPIQVGGALAERRFPGFLQDDGGENISRLNRAYCELTAQYWVWKNLKADYYGFFHYRRYLYPDLGAKRPYTIESSPTQELLERLNFAALAGIVQEHELIAPIGENMFMPVREHYGTSKHHHRKDLALTEHIVQELYPGYSRALEEYLSQTVCHFGNIFIMEHGLFHRYCAWLFSILAEFDRRADLSGYSAQELRVDGYLAERLLGVFYTQCRMEGVRCVELPRMDFIADERIRRKRKLLYALLPPGTKRRAVVKRWSGL